ncbi:acyl carrier protein [Kitasatospora sp. NBC_00374]|uniref:acyl carrier protein n=1 Tax=Kitasatospora sp. NBC_00374 TaxID=2975964 RepID=UPI0030E07B57
MSETYEILRDCLVTEFDVPPGLVRPEAVLSGLDLDSLALVELSLMVEERLGVTVTDIGPDRTLGELAALADADRAAGAVS